MKVLFVDMDNVLVDFPSGIDRISDKERSIYGDRLDEVPGIFGLMTPLEDAIDSFHKLSQTYDTYILSTAPWENPSAWSDKLLWVKKYIGDVAHKRLILSHNKNLNYGDYLIDDTFYRGQKDFEGEWLHFGSKKYPGWDSVMEYMNKQV